MRREIFILGAGPAGLAAADALTATAALRHRYRVTVFDAAARTGGKCGAVDTPDGPPIEHGPHVFPAWYRNTREVLATVGADRHLVDVRGLWLLRPGLARPDLRCFEPPTSPGAAARLLTRGPLPARGMTRYLALLADLVAEADRELAADPTWDAPRSERVRGRADADQASLDDAVVLGALAVAGASASARTIARTTSFFLRTPRPYLSVLDGPMHDVWIAPWERRLESSGVGFELGIGAAAVRPGPAVTFAGAGGPRSCDALVVATPLEVTRRLLDLPEAGRLETGPMGALDVWVDGDARLPPGPALLEGSAFALTFLNLSELWTDPGADGHHEAGTRLSFIVPAGVLRVGDDPEPLLADVRRWLGPSVGVRRWRWRSNQSAPLFLNTCGSWQARPDPDGSGLERVWLAGDWVRHPIDVATMEGAVWSGREAARRLDRAMGGDQVRAPRAPPTLPRRLLRAMSAAGRALTGI